MENRMLDALGFIGLGAIGFPMARRMANGDPRMFVNDLNQATVSRFLSESENVEAARSPREVGDAADVVFLSMPNVKAGEAVIFGDDGLIHGNKVKTIVDLSTTGATFAIKSSTELAKRNIAYLDSPVSGGIAGAEAGTISVMTSGPEDTYQAIRPYLERIGKSFFYIGDKAGQAQTMKLVNNIISSTGFANACQALVFGTKAGLDPDMMIDVINSSTGRISATLTKIPKGILPRTFETGAKTFVLAKDSGLCIDEAALLGVDMTVAKAAQKIWQHMMAAGAADDDVSTVIKFLEEPAGVVVRGKAAK